MRLPIRSEVRRRKFRDWFRRRDPAEPDFKKISVVSPPITSPPPESETDDSLEAHLERLKRSREKMPCGGPCGKTHHP
jgi:hypothetical protein